MIPTLYAMEEKTFERHPMVNAKTNFEKNINLYEEAVPPALIKIFAGRNYAAPSVIEHTNSYLLVFMSGRKPDENIGKILEEYNGKEI